MDRWLALLLWVYSKAQTSWQEGLAEGRCLPCGSLEQRKEDRKESGTRYTVKGSLQ
jgi:hypothetical protein